MGIILTILLFGVLIFIHEFGHFITAKLSGVKVNEFALGMGPVIWKTRKKDTQYALRLLPIGGFVSMEGEDEDSEEEGSFSKARIWNKILIVTAGALMNLILGFLHSRGILRHGPGWICRRSFRTLQQGRRPRIRHNPRTCQRQQ